MFNNTRYCRQKEHFAAIRNRGAHTLRSHNEVSAVLGACARSLNTGLPQTMSVFEKACKALDRDESGLLNEKEFKQALQESGLSTSTKHDTVSWTFLIL